MSSYKKLRGDNNQQNDIASPHNNFIQVFGDGSGKIITCFICLLSASAIGYLFIVYHTIFVVLFFGVVLFFTVIGGSVAWRHVSHTRKQHLVNEEEIKWAKKIYVTEYLIATENPKLRFENAQQVSIQQHLAAPQTTVSEWPQNRQEREIGGDGYSEVLNR